MNHLKNEELNKQEYKNKKTTLSSFPQQLNVELNIICNARCAFCYAHVISSEKNTSAENYDVLNELQEYIEAAKGVGFQGDSEPSVDPCFYKAVSLSKDKRLAICTNAINIEKLKPVLEDHKGELYIQISLETLEEDNYQFIVGVKNIKKTLENIKWFSELKKRKNNIFLSLGTVLLKTNYHEIFDIMQLANEYGFDEYKLQAPILSTMYSFPDLHRNGKIFNYLDQYPYNCLEAYKDEYNKMCKYLQTTRKEFKASLIKPDMIKPITTKYRLLNAIASSINKILGKNLIRTLGNRIVRDLGLLLYSENLPIKCDQPWTFTILNADGSVRLCCPSSYTLGNYKKQPFKKIWNNWRYRRIRSLMAKGRTPYVCRKFNCAYYRAAKKNK